MTQTTKKSGLRRAFEWLFDFTCPDFFVSLTQVGLHPPLHWFPVREQLCEAAKKVFSEVKTGLTSRWCNYSLAYTPGIGTTKWRIRARKLAEDSFAYFEREPQLSKDDRPIVFMVNGNGDPSQLSVATTYEVSHLACTLDAIVVTWNYRGNDTNHKLTGRTDRFWDYPTDVDVQDCIRVIRDVKARYPTRRFAAIGCSYGGMVMTKAMAALEEPEAKHPDTAEIDFARSIVKINIAGFADIGDIAWPLSWLPTYRRKCIDTGLVPEESLVDTAARLKNYFAVSIENDKTVPQHASMQEGLLGKLQDHMAHHAINLWLPHDQATNDGHWYLLSGSELPGMGDALPITKLLPILINKARSDITEKRDNASRCLSKRIMRYPTQLQSVYNLMAQQEGTVLDRVQSIIHNPIFKQYDLSRRDDHFIRLLRDILGYCYASLLLQNLHSEYSGETPLAYKQQMREITDMVPGENRSFATIRATSVALSVLLVWCVGWGLVGKPLKVFFSFWAEFLTGIGWLLGDVCRLNTVIGFFTRIDSPVTRLFILASYILAGAGYVCCDAVQAVVGLPLAGLTYFTTFLSERLRLGSFYYLKKLLWYQRPPSPIDTDTQIPASPTEAAAKDFIVVPAQRTPAAFNEWPGKAAAASTATASPFKPTSS